LEKDTVGKLNIVPNASFEKGDTKNPSLPAKWMVLNETKESVKSLSLDATTALDESHSLKISNNEKDILLISETFRINFNSGYYIKFAAKSSAALTVPLRLQFWTYDEKGKRKNRFSKRLRTTTDWKKASISAGFFKNSVSFARIAIYVPKDTKNTIWLDDIGCYQVHHFNHE
jgi:hypothetical protein